MSYPALERSRGRSFDEETLRNSSPTPPLHRASSRKSILTKVVVPTLFAFLLTGGLGTTFITWLLGHQYRYERSFGSFLVDEGTKKDSPNEATLRGLTISSVTSTLVSLVNPLVMTLLAYLIALRWLVLQQRIEASESRRDSKSLPTPVQYGLMMRLLSGESIFALCDSLRYVLRGPRRATAPNLFKITLFAAFVSYALTHAVGAADLWLHVTASASVVNTSTPIISPLSYSIAFNHTICNGWVNEDGPYIHACLVNEDEWARNQPWVISAGLDIASNSSHQIAVNTFYNAADATDATVLIPRNTDSAIEFRASTYGVRTSCRSLNPICDRLIGPSASYSWVQNCSNVGLPFLPFSVNDLQGPGPRSGSVILGRIDDTLIGALFGMYKSPNLSTNPFSVYLQLQWPKFTTNVDEPAPSLAVDMEPTTMTTYAECNMTFFEAVVRRPTGDDSKQYVLEEERPTDRNMTTILMGPLLSQLATEKFAANMHATAMTESELPNMEAALSQELGRMAIGIAGGFFKMGPTLLQERIGTKIVGNYPLIPVLVFCVTLYIYAALVFVVVAWAIVGFISADRHLTGSVPTAQLRLSNPMAAVAALFPSSTAADPWRRKDALDLFEDGTDDTNTERLYLTEGGVCVAEFSSKARYDSNI